MKYSDTQYMVVRHDNAKGNPHVHIFFNRVDNNGKYLSAWQDFRRNADACRKLTVKYGLNMAKGRSYTIVNDLHGFERVRYQISNEIDASLPGLECPQQNPPATGYHDGIGPPEQR